MRDCSHVLFPPSGGSDSVAVDTEATVRSLQAQLVQAQQELQSVRLESSKIIAALRKVAEQLSEELHTAESVANARVVELESRIRVLELELAERPTREELSVVEGTAADRIAEAQARTAELSMQLASMRDTLVSEQVEQLVAQVRALEVQLAERPDAQQVAALEAQVRDERARAEAAASALAVKPTTLTVEAAPVVARAIPRATSDIEDQLRRIELILESIPEPGLMHPALGEAGRAAAPAVGPAPPRAAPSESAHRVRSGQFTHPGRRRLFRRERGYTTNGSISSGGVEDDGVGGDATPFQRAPAGSFTLRRHVFTSA